MMIIELTEDKFGKAIRDIACIEEKLEGIKFIFEGEAMGYRKHKDYPEYEEEDEEIEPSYRMGMRGRRSRSGRYM